VRCVDRFPVLQLASDALEEIHREAWKEARRAGQSQLARDLKGARCAPWKNPENLSARQRAKLAEIEATNRPLFRAYPLKQQLRQI
jgi:transposase